MKVVINTQYGGFSLSPKAVQRLAELQGRPCYDSRPEDRADPLLVQVVEELGSEANGAHASLAVVEIPDDVDYIIEEYDGKEWIAEAHRTWGDE